MCFNLSHLEVPNNGIIKHSTAENLYQEFCNFLILLLAASIDASFSLNGVYGMWSVYKVKARMSTELYSKRTQPVQRSRR